MVKYAALGVVLGVIGGLSLSTFINNHFDSYERKCYSLLYVGGRGTTTTEIPCR